MKPKDNILIKFQETLQCITFCHIQKNPLWSMPLLVDYLFPGVSSVHVSVLAWFIKYLCC